jgi:hypothetical protein
VNVREEIVSQFKQVAQEQKKRLPPLRDELELLDSGLDSLGLDPFSLSEDAEFPVTFGDFVGLYEYVAK